MSDIFLSCVIDDGVTAQKLAAVFRRQGWTVWWDASTITPGADYLEAVMQEVARAKIVVVLWSRAARVSRLVAAALNRAEQPSRVVVRLERMDLYFRQKAVNVFDLSDWGGAESHAGVQALLQRVRVLIGASSPTPAPPESLEEISLPEIQESARLGIKAGAGSPPEDDARFKGVFISYRRGEAAAYAGRLYDRLAARFGREKVFVDTENVAWGEDFVEAITAAAEGCAVMIALISREWSRGAGGEAESDDYVRLEVAKALGRKVRVIPILIQGASMPAPKDLPEDLAPLVRRNALALSDTRWERDVEDLIKTLESLVKD